MSPTTHRSFDDQAGSFDRRAGLPQAVCDAIAQEILRITAIGPADLLLEVGAGTGQIGRALCAMPLRYLGIDASPAMLALFAQRCRQDGVDAPVAVADAGRRWPTPDGSVSVIFGSRSLHLLPLRHVIDEVLRAGVHGRSCVLVGRVERDRHGLRARLRREMRERLAGRGHAPRDDGHKRERELLAALIERGAVAIEPSVAAAWPVSRNARELIAAWRVKSGLAGVDVSDAEKEDVLSELGRWAQEAMGSLDAVDTTEEQYMLSGARLPTPS